MEESPDAPGLHLQSLTMLAAAAPGSYIIPSMFFSTCNVLVTVHLAGTAVTAVRVLLLCIAAAERMGGTEELVMGKRGCRKITPSWFACGHNKLYALCIIRVLLHVLHSNTNNLRRSCFYRDY